MTVTGSEIMETLRFEPKVREHQREGQLEILQPFVEAMPTVLAEYLSQLASVKTLMGAKVAFIRYCLDNGIIDRAGKLLPEEAFGWISRESGLQMMRGMMEDLLERLGPIIEDVQKYLEQNGLTDRAVMLSSEVGLTASLAKQYDAGTLTIEEILREQPGIIILTED